MAPGGQYPETGNSSVQPGTELNQTYRIDSLIGIGGMGEVFQGHNIQTGDSVAIKIVLPEFARDDLILDLFRKEARILNHLAHDAIVRYYVFSMDAAIGRPYLAMEFVDGQSLAERLKSKPLSLEECTVLRRRVADGLHKAHEAGIVHRDIAPDNVILPGGRVERAKIIDFGIAKSANVGGGTLLGGSFAGKYNFVSPEQLGLFAAEVTAKSDIYSLGLVLAAAIQGEPIDMSGSQVEVIEKRRTVPDLSRLPKEIQGLLRSMLEPDPAARLPTMAAVRDWNTGGTPALGGSEPTLVGPRHSAVGRDAQPPRPGMPQPQPYNPGAAKPKILRRGAAMAVIALAAVAAGSLGGWYYVGTQDEKTGPPATTATEPVSPAPTPPVAKSQPTPSAGEETSGDPQPAEVPSTPPPAETPEEPVIVPPPAASGDIRAGFLENYQGGDCFLALAEETLGTGSLILAYGNRKQTFEQFASAYRAALGEDANARFSQVTVAQCPVLSLLRQVERARQGKSWLKLLRVNLRDSKIANDSELSGSLEGLRHSNWYLLVIDDEGAVYNLTGKISPAGNRLEFSERFKVTEQSRGRNQIILAISASLPLGILAQSGATLKPADLNRLMSELDAPDMDVAADLKTFSIE